MIHYNTWNQYTTEIPLHRLTKQVTHNIHQPASLIPGRNPLRCIDIELNGKVIKSATERKQQIGHEESCKSLNLLGWNALRISRMIHYDQWSQYTSVQGSKTCNSEHTTASFCLCNIESNEKQCAFFWQSNAHVWSITSLFLQHQASWKTAVFER